MAFLRAILSVKASSACYWVHNDKHPVPNSPFMVGGATGKMGQVVVLMIKSECLHFSRIYPQEHFTRPGIFTIQVVQPVVCRVTSSLGAGSKARLPDVKQVAV
ncbi:hypothetical protein GA0116948_104256 [Chitinophaga costaii]|uniref:Uncharacterized protein n=1 Tax=Chitinophaga costaii TaxID=1335309 RepID=A0A1C4CR78_9BACT|nr:hypothetical protein GA0116948_104256 [Chitinophaga costaii]